uniref:Transporter n=1 Tax=Cyprinus carpio TaxID=7962 RepID=A0A8C1PVC6_CYPCA
MEKPPLLDGEDGSVLAESRSDVALVSADEEGSAGAHGQEDDRPAWDSKLQYVLAQVGFSVGLGNVWRFPYLCHQNGGGAFMLLYVMLLLIIGVPLFFMELAAGQSIRQGSIGVWKHISPRLAGIGYSSCMVCFFVALYYNVIIAWSLFYMGNSFQYPLPWEQCPVDMISNQTGMTFIVSIFLTMLVFHYLCEILVMYFSSVFPYAVLICFLIRGLMLDGAIEGIKYMFYPKLEIWGEVQVWRQAATQVFFALGLGYGSVIAYSSYNPVHNNCHRDAIMVSGINFMTSVLASLVVFVVLGFRAKNIALNCVATNVVRMAEMAKTGSAQHWWPWFNMSDPKLVALQDYREWYSHYGSLLGSNITDCDLEREMSKGVEGTGLAFIAFTEAMALFPASPFWSTLFFLMLLNLGLSTMFGTMQGILTPLMDNFRVLGRHKTMLTVCSCILGFFIGLLFTQRSGNYFVTMFDDYSATLPLIIVVVFETVSVAWIYGADRFLDDVEVMLRWRPPVVYCYLWKYVCLLGMVGLLAASLLRMVFKRPTYTAWNHTTGSETSLEYPGWALVMLSTLIIVASLPVPVGYLLSFLRVQPPRERYSKYNSSEPEPNNHHSPLDEDRNRPRSTFLHLGAEHYVLLPQQEDGEEEEEEEEDTGL